MLHVAFLLLAQAAAGQAPVLKAELKDVAPQGKSGPSVLCQGSTNLPNGALLDAFLYYNHVNEGKQIAKGVATVQAGKFVHEFDPFPTSKKNLAGRYIALLRFNTGLQNLAFPGFTDSLAEFVLEIGAPADVETEAKAIREQLAGEIRALTALGDQVKAKIQELKGKSPEAWAAPQKEWLEKALQIQQRADPRKVPEYNVLGLDLIASSGLENLTNVLVSVVRHAAGGKTEDALEGLTRLRQTAEYWVSEVASPRLTNPRDIVTLIESARKLLSETKPDAPVLPVRRKFVEFNALLQKSLPEDFQPIVLELGTRSTAYFAALSDKEPNAKELHAELDTMLEKLASTLRALK